MNSNNSTVEGWKVFSATGCSSCYVLQYRPSQVNKMCDNEF